MDKEQIKKFFNQRASKWDEENIQNEETLAKILDNAQIRSGLDVLDVACGTGVLFPYYVQRRVASITGIDLSNQMAKIAQEKFPEARIICGDAELYTFDQIFDRIMVYNALPHFPNVHTLLGNLIRYLRPGGIISVAHGLGREKLNKYHQQHAEEVSLKLMEIEELEEQFVSYARVTLSVSDAHMYQLVGIRSD